MCTRSRECLIRQLLLYAIPIFASLGVFLFGYDQGSMPRHHCEEIYNVMNGIITGSHFNVFFEGPTSIETGSMVAILEISVFGREHSVGAETGMLYVAATSLVAGQVGDMIGRKGTLLLGALIFTIGSTVRTSTSGFIVMLIGRIMSGFGVGLLSCIVYQTIDQMTVIMLNSPTPDSQPSSKHTPEKSRQPSMSEEDQQAYWQNIEHMNQLLATFLNTLLELAIKSRGPNVEADLLDLSKVTHQLYKDMKAARKHDAFNACVSAVAANKTAHTMVG
ncbi:hypothetical protein FISHEDRAFT_56014 [Fistulina hepatica ATCC 64428]|uniref:Major facilitator superfamily (MFS) profile domain-containing protein n=1 Tax=Fistulina hepatica ATCC 64428 TaxID=1128425 RepID=A0A0D7ANA8_9AGAR|nr:hypothetical protein FISHEDRAFT_56014 [Fistulina hepatica ATCC 64428]